MLTDYEVFSERLRSAVGHCMDHVGETRASVARKSRLSPSQVGDFLAGRKKPGLRTLVRLAHGLGVQLFQLVAMAEAGEDALLLEDLEVPTIDDLSGNRARFVLERIERELCLTDERLPQHDRSWRGTAGWAKHGYLLGYLDALSDAEAFLAGDWMVKDLHVEQEGLDPRLTKAMLEEFGRLSAPVPEALARALELTPAGGEGE